MNDYITGEFVIKDLKRLLNLLIQDLYGNDPHIALRELIQNAHDAQVAQQDADPGHSPLIRVRLNATSRPNYIEVFDNGVGMTEADIQRELCVIGNEDKLADARKIGRFGIGFLSAFILADHVEVWTKATQSEALHWQTTDAANWRVNQLSVDFEHGTRVRLYFKDRYESDVDGKVNELKTLSELRRVVTAYCYILPYPVLLASEGMAASERRLNATEPPWSSESAAMNAYQELFGGNDPTFVHSFDVSSETGLCASGCLYFGDKVELTPAMKLYVQRILVRDSDTRLLPAYAPFVTGFVECPKLSVDLARKDISSFGPAYDWLRMTAFNEFQRAFVHFADHRKNDFLRLWPSIDSTLLYRSIRAAHEVVDRVLEQAADSFVLSAGRHIPFYVIDRAVGAYSRPRYRTISEMAKDSGGSIEHPAIIHYTESQAPIEKELLLEHYDEFIDVGRPDKPAYKDFLSYFARLRAANGQDQDFQLQAAEVARFTSLPPSAKMAWSGILQVLQSDINFQGRRCDVMVEEFEPVESHVVVTDVRVDRDVANRLRGELARIAQSPDAAEVTTALIRELDRQGGEGTVTIHVNANSPLMVRLRDLWNSKEKNLILAAEKCTLAIGWRAVLDYFGPMSTRSMIQQDRQFVESLVKSVLDLTEHADPKIEATGSRIAQDQIARPSSTDGIVGFIDLSRSTELLTLPSLSHDRANELLYRIAEHLEDALSGYELLAFLGDGYQFAITSPQNGQPLFVNRVNTLSAALGAALSEFEEVSAHEVEQLSLRVGMACGQLRVAQLNGRTTYVGLPAVEAARIVAERDLHSQTVPISIVLTTPALDKGVGFGLWKPSDAQSLQPRQLRGVPGPPLRLHQLRSH